MLVLLGSINKVAADVAAAAKAQQVAEEVWSVASMFVTNFHCLVEAVADAVD